MNMTFKEKKIFQINLIHFKKKTNALFSNSCHYMKDLDQINLQMEFWDQPLKLVQLIEKKVTFGHYIIMG